MSRIRKATLITGALVIAAAFMGYAFYITFVAGTTDGPDFVRAVQSGRVTADAITSIEVVEPLRGHMPFTEREYEQLPRRTTIDSAATIEKLLSMLKGSERGLLSQNHPTNPYSAYLKVNTQDGFYWIYVDVHRDWTSAILQVRANTGNAANPNGATTYHLSSFSEVLKILQGGADDGEG